MSTRPLTRPRAADQHARPPRHLGPASSGAEDEIEHDPALGGSCGDFGLVRNPAGKSDEVAQAEPHVSDVGSTRGARGLLEQLPRPARVVLHPASFSFPAFHACRGQFYKPAKETAGRSRAVETAPQILPGLVRLPIVAVVEKVHGIQIRAGRAPKAWLQGSGLFSLQAVTMSAGIARGMRKPAGTKA